MPDKIKRGYPSKAASHIIGRNLPTSFKKPARKPRDGLYKQVSRAFQAFEIKHGPSVYQMDFRRREKSP